MSEEIPEIVDYSTFVNELTSGSIVSVDLYEFGREIDITYQNSAGEFHGTKKRYRPKDDELLTYTLRQEGIPYTVHAEEFKSPDAQFEWLALTSMSFFLVPILLLIIVIYQARTIRLLSRKIIGETDPT